MLLVHVIGNNASNSIAISIFLLVIVLLFAIPSSGRRSNVQKQKSGNEIVYFYLTLSTYFLSYMYANLQITFLHVRKYFVKISML